MLFNISNSQEFISLLNMNRVNALLFSLLIFLAGCIGGEDVDISEDSLKPEIYRENLTEIDKPREMSIYYGYPNKFDVSEVPTIL